MTSKLSAIAYLLFNRSLKPTVLEMKEQADFLKWLDDRQLKYADENERYVRKIELEKASSMAAKFEIRTRLEDMLVKNKFDKLDERDKETISELFTIIRKEWVK